MPFEYRTPSRRPIAGRAPVRGTAPAHPPRLWTGCSATCAFGAGHRSRECRGQALLITLAVGTGADATVFSFVDALLFRPAEGCRITSGASRCSPATGAGPPYRQLVVSGLPVDAVGDDLVRGACRVRQRRCRRREDWRHPNARSRAASRANSSEFWACNPQSAVSLARDVAADAPRVAVIGHDIWQRAFGSDPGILGRRSRSTAGIWHRRRRRAPIHRPRPRQPRRESGFRWAAATTRPRSVTSRGFRVIGRLKPGATLDGAQAELTLLAAKLAETLSEHNIGTQTPNAPRPMSVVRHARLDPEDAPRDRPRERHHPGGHGARAADRVRERREPAAVARDDTRTAKWPSAWRSAPAAATSSDSC